MFERLTTSHRRNRSTVSGARAFQGVLLLLGIVLFGYAFVESSAGKNEYAAEPELFTPVEPQEKDYSHFTHTNAMHSRLPCLLCHRRDNNSPRISFPGKSGHLPCAGCHALQFSDSSSPICTICHTNSTTGAMKRFPGLRSFGMKFDHTRHARVNCATCHKSSGNGAARSIPSGSNAHTTCFQCHSSRASDAMISCNVCHQPGRLVRTPATSVAFRKSFSHARHITAKSMNCASCHTLRPGAPRGRQMSSPLTSMHFAPERSLSCGGCHNGKRAFGADEFTNCRRCHRGNSFKF